MAKLVILLGFLAITMVSAKPAKKEALDKATASDIVINSVNPEKPLSNIEEIKEVVPVETASSNSNVYLTDVSFGTPSGTQTSNVKPGATVARIIDDIFQIPISVLQSVARLLRNPFLTHKTPETAASY